MVVVLCFGLLDELVCILVMELIIVDIFVFWLNLLCKFNFEIKVDLVVFWEIVNLNKCEVDVVICMIKLIEDMFIVKGLCFIEFGLFCFKSYLRECEFE